jgi:hypothetical protein
MVKKEIPKRKPNNVPTREYRLLIATAGAFKASVRPFNNRLETLGISWRIIPEYSFEKVTKQPKR